MGSAIDAVQSVTTREDLRIGLVLGSSTGGMGRHVLSLVRGLTAHGAAVSVYCPATTEAQFDFAGAGATVAPLEIPARPGGRDLGAVGDLRRLLRADVRARDERGGGDASKAQRADPVTVLHAHGLRAGLVAALARPSSTPLVVTWHNPVLGNGVRERALRVAERVVARSANVTLGASEDLVARATALGARDARLGPVAAPALPVSPGGAELVRAELEAVGRPLIVSVGRLHPQKGYHTFIAAAAHWRRLDPKPVVVIAGTGPAYRQLAAQILSTRAPVTLLGHRDDVGDLLAAADLAVVSSAWEARQLFAQEALRSGTPLVATRVGGLPDLVGDAACLVPPDDVDALDDAVRTLLGDEDMRARYAAAGIARAATWPTESQTVELVRAVYADLVASAVRP
jgi:glycosyltransferase involved in cell wall biosynthesis